MTREQTGNLNMTPSDQEKANRDLIARNGIQIAIAEKHASTDLLSGEMLQKISPKAHEVFEKRPDLLENFHANREAVIAETERLLELDK